MSEKKNSLEEKRILQKKLQWYTLEAEEGEFNATEVEAMLERLDELESLPEKEDGANFSEPKESFKAGLSKICRGKCGKLSKKKRADVEIRSLLFCQRIGAMLNLGNVKSGAIYPILKKYKTEKWNVRGIF